MILIGIDQGSPDVAFIHIYNLHVLALFPHATARLMKLIVLKNKILVKVLTFLLTIG